MVIQGAREQGASIRNLGIGREQGGACEELGEQIGGRRTR